MVSEAVVIFLVRCGYGSQWGLAGGCRDACRRGALCALPGLAISRCRRATPNPQRRRHRRQSMSVRRPMHPDSTCTSCFHRLRPDTGTDAHQTHVAIYARSPHHYSGPPVLPRPTQPPEHQPPPHRVCVQHFLVPRSSLVPRRRPSSACLACPSPHRPPLPAMAPAPALTFSAALQDYLHRPRQITSKISIAPVDLKWEGIALLLSLAFVFLHAIGKRRNRSLAHNWVQQALPVIEKEFATTAKDSNGKGELLLWNGGDEAVLYASGRRGVERSVHPLHLSHSPRS